MLLIWKEKYLKLRFFPVESVRYTMWQEVDRDRDYIWAGNTESICAIKSYSKVIQKEMEKH